ncbi:hypothetical protein PG984_011515 [Apiospora sp. TS-2023a]
MWVTAVEKQYHYAMPLMRCEAATETNHHGLVVQIELRLDEFLPLTQLAQRRVGSKMTYRYLTHDLLTLWPEARLRLDQQEGHRQTGPRSADAREMLHRCRICAFTRAPEAAAARAESFMTSRADPGLPNVSLMAKAPLT